MTPRTTGIYGLFRLDGGPINPEDARALGVPVPSSPTSCAVMAIDNLEAGAIHQTSDGNGTAILLGHIEERAALAARLGLRQDTPPLALAVAAHDRFGDDLPREMMGGWTLLRWQSDRRRLLVMQSIDGRNAVLYTRQGPLLAMAPDLQQLLRLSWISADLHTPELVNSLLSNLSRAAPDNRTFVRAVHTLARSRTLRSDVDGDFIHVADPHLPVTPWRGSFEEAMATAEEMLRSNVRRIIASTPRVAAFNSGGLDSSLLSWIASTEKRPGQAIPLIASAVDADRGIADEVPYSRIVADHLGEPLYPVIPPRDANPFRPRIDDFLNARTPPLSPRHYLYDSFKDQALALGVTHILDGALGELTFTSPLELPGWKRRLHLRLRAIRMRITHPDLQPRWPDDAASVWLRPALMEMASKQMRDPRGKHDSQSMTRRRGEPWGYTPTLDMMMNRSTSDMLGGKLRLVTPLTGIRIQQLFAGFPVDYMMHNGLDRSPARHVLLGNLPDSISLRPKGLAFSPDYHERLGEHAAAAAARIPLFRDAGLGEWFDLDRLEAGLGKVHRYERAQLHSTFKIQMTAHTCEFFLWWLNGRPMDATVD